MPSWIPVSGMTDPVLPEPLWDPRLTEADRPAMVTGEAWRALRRSARFWITAGLVVLFAVMATWPQLFVAPSPAPADPRECSLRASDGSFQDRLLPSSEHWFGTDVQGCDYYTRTIYGARTSLGIAAAATVLALIPGVLLGLTAGYLGGWPDAVISRFTDIFFAIPYIIGAILLLTALGGENRTASEVLVVIAALSWPLPSRIVRAAALQARSQEYVEAARAMGAPTSRILFRHVLPNSFAPVIVYASLSAGSIIGLEALLSFLGVGLQLPAVSWGLMIKTAESHLLDVPHLLFFPGLFVTVAVLAFFLLGDVLRQALDPHLRT